MYTKKRNHKGWERDETIKYLKFFSLPTVQNSFGSI